MPQTRMLLSRQLGAIPETAEMTGAGRFDIELQSDLTSSNSTHGSAPICDNPQTFAPDGCSFRSVNLLCRKQSQKAIRRLPALSRNTFHLSRLDE